MNRRSAVVGALALVGLTPPAALGAQPAEPELVSVELSSFRFAPDMLAFEHGRTYRLHLVDTSSGGHDFTAPEFFASSAIAAGDRKSVVDGKVRLHGGESVDVTLTPQTPGTYELRCSHFLHAGFGMRGTITVR